MGRNENPGEIVDMPATGSSEEIPIAARAAGGTRRWGRRLLLLAIVLLLAVAATFSFLEPYDLGTWRMIVRSSLAMALLLSMIYFATGTRLPAAVRWSPLVLTGVALAAFLAKYRFAGFTGDLGLRWEDRWAVAPPRLDEDIKAPSQPAEALAVGPRDYPQFLGPNRNGRVDFVRLDPDWQSKPPRLVWSRPIGEGWSTFSVVAGRAVTQEQRDDAEMVTCYDLATGELLWTHSESVRFQQAMGGVGPRATPTIHQGKVYALGATGLLNCLDLASGESLWRVDIVADNGAENVMWGRACSPLVVDEKVIVSAGGPDGNSLVAYHKDTGEKIWSGGDARSAYASPVVGLVAGERQVVIVNENQVAGHDLATGKVLWTHPWPGSSDGNANCSQSVLLDGDRVLLSKGYSGGSEMLHIRRNEDGTFTAESLWKNPRVLKTKFNNVVVRDGHAYGMSEVIMECVDLADGQVKWRKRPRDYGHAQLLLVGDLILAMTETSGEVALVQATPERYRELARYPVLEVNELLASGMTWNNPALAGKYLLVRNARQAACYQLPVVSAGAGEGASIAEDSPKDIR